MHAIIRSCIILLTTQTKEKDADNRSFSKRENYMKKPHNISVEGSLNLLQFKEMFKVFTNYTIHGI